MSYNPSSINIIDQSHVGLCHENHISRSWPNIQLLVLWVKRYYCNTSLGWLVTDASNLPNAYRKPIAADSFITLTPSSTTSVPRRFNIKETPVHHSPEISCYFMSQQTVDFVTRLNFNQLIITYVYIHDNSAFV
jgi:hypothetical protein